MKSECLLRLEAAFENKALYEKTIVEHQQLLNNTSARLSQIQEADLLKQKNMSKEFAEAHAKDQQAKVYSILIKRIEGCKNVINQSQNSIKLIDKDINEYQLQVNSLNNVEEAQIQNNKEIYKKLNLKFAGKGESDFDNLSVEDQNQFIEYISAKEKLEKQGVDLSGCTDNI